MSITDSFIDRPIRSVETSSGIDILQARLLKIGRNAEMREYGLQHCVLLYVLSENKIFLLAIRHHKQLSFDLQALW